MQDLNWNDLRYILAVARSKSLAAASRILNVNESTVSRRIKRAEQKLDAMLFERVNGKLHPTHAGSLVIAGAERIELETQDIERVVAGSNHAVTGKVRLTAVPLVMHHIIVPALPTLSEQHPELTLELISEPKDLSLTQREADIALRLARPTEEMRAIARKAGQLDYAIYASGKHAEQPLPWIQFEDTMRDIPQALWITRQLDSGELPGTLVNDGETMFACIKAGMGKSLLPVVVGDNDGDLTRLRPDICLSRELWIMIHPDLKQLARIRAVVDWLLKTLTALQQ